MNRDELVDSYETRLSAQARVIRELQDRLRARQQADVATAPQLVPADERDEPPVGSIVLRHGPTGTAYQRLHSTGLWHGTVTDVALTWDRMFDHTRSVLVAYRAEES